MASHERQTRLCFSFLFPILVLALAGCVSASRTIELVELDSPKANQGLLTADAKDDGLKQLAQALQKSEHAVHRGSDAAASTKERLLVSEAGADLQNGGKGVSGAEAPVQLASVGGNSSGAPEPGKLIALPKMSATEIEELVSAIRLKLETEQSYRAAQAADVATLPPIPSGLNPGPMLSKTGRDGLAIIRLGHRRFLSQPAQLWIDGAVVKPTAKELAANPDLNSISTMVDALVASADERKKNLGSEDLGRRLIRLSYIDVAGAMKALKGFGLNTAEDLANVPKPIPFEQLPLVAAMPSPDTNHVSLLGAEKVEKGPFELSLTPSVATPLPGVVNTAPTEQLVVFFHQAHPEQFGRVKQLLDEFIDRPERQIFVEGMVLEINEEGLKELGIEWQFKEGNFEWIAGSLASAGTAMSTAQLNFDSLQNFDKNWVAKLKALVVEKKAEVLSRPSVLTVNNRQATIRVGTDIPIATSQQEPGAFAAPGTVAFNFKYLATGISLNVMPRANEAGDQVSLLIDTIVSAQVPGADLELRSASGALLASAPSMATRRIQTYARIDNNTPFIIGGLVNKEYATTRDKIPVLGDIPYLGALFRSKRTSTNKREVIVVLTPHILEPGKGKLFGQFMPKDEDRFDEFGNILFRDTYRIRSEDVFDLSFITDNPRLQGFRDEANRAIIRDFRLAYTEPFSQFADNRFPGENILVRRMVWEVVRRLSTTNGLPNNKWLSSNINPERLIVFESQQTGGGFGVQFLERILSRLAGSKDFDSFFTGKSGKALVLTFYGRPPAASMAESITVPIPEFRLVDCPDHQKSWNTLLWDLNQPDDKGLPRYSIVLRDRSDLVRLQRALIVKKIVALNGGNTQMSLSNFSLGKLLLMPEPKPDQFHPVDGEVAQYFFQIEKYYEATLQVIERTLAGMEKAGRNTPTVPPQ
ncbi:MAG: hypothetical protein HYY23_16100 [Verrucomicrobia bacterium]|nr:hypothetical protein [Verrucomicrobiota bacterium]